MKSKELKVRELVLGTIVLIALVLCIVFYGAVPDKMVLYVGQAWDKWLLWVLTLLSAAAGGYVLSGNRLQQGKRSGKRSRLSGSVRLMMLVAAALTGVFSGAVIITQVLHIGLDIIRLTVALTGIFILVDGWLLSGVYRRREVSGIMQKVFSLRSKLLIVCGIAAALGGVIFGGTIALGILAVCLLLYLCAFAASAYITRGLGAPELKQWKMESGKWKIKAKVRKPASRESEPKPKKTKSHTAEPAAPVRKKRTAPSTSKGKHTAAPARKKPAAPARPKAPAKSDEYEDLFSSSDYKPADSRPAYHRNEDAKE